MKHLTPTEASRIMFALLQKVRTSTNGGGQLSLAAVSTLFAVMKNPGELQFDLIKEVGGVSAAAISRQIDLLDGNTKTKAGEQIPRLVRRDRADTSRVNNKLNLTPEGEQFAREFADYFNKLLERAAR